MSIDDHFTKFAQAYAMPDATAQTVAHFIVDFMLTYGISDQIITDQGTNFQSELLQHVYDLLDTKHAQHRTTLKQMVIQKFSSER